MDIKRAKQEIKDSIEAYLAKDEFGEYLIPAIRQRPILLMGAPGIGKTQIMEQIARECKVGLVSYTITHHTRQSAVGLPFIKEKTFGQETFSVTEYTMSEIIASVYEKMEKTGLREGILFIDEIYRQNLSLSRKELFKAGLRVGRDMMGTDSNTLILAFAGSSVSTLLLDYSYNLPYQQIINSNNIGIAIMQGLAGSFGIVLSVPFTVLICTILFHKK